MVWNYSGRPGASDRDTVRFLMGDTVEAKPLVSDEEIAFALTEHAKPKLAAALCLRHLAAQASRLPDSRKVGDLSAGGLSKIADAYTKRADELDPAGVTKGSILALPSFGGLTHSGKQELAEDSDAVQPRFERGMFDIPGGPTDGGASDDDELIS